MKMISTVSPITSGSLRVLGHDPDTEGRSIRSHLGVVPQEDNLDVELTVSENLYVYGRYHDMPRPLIKERTAELLEFAQLSDRADARVESLSGGMKRRLTIARALINDPDLVILDEPTTGLDPQARHLLWDRLYRLKRQGSTLIVTTHYMDEAEQLCDRLVVMDKGKIAAEGSPRSLIEKYAPREVVELRVAEGQREQVALELDGLANRSEVLADRILLYTDDADKTQQGMHERGIHPEQVLVRRSTLEDVFLRLTGRRLID
jgi:lipooligosaccharide transport system ATP-binding protein